MTYHLQSICLKIVKRLTKCIVPKEHIKKNPPEQDLLGKRPNLDHWDRITNTLENQERFWSAGRQKIDSFNPFNTAICTEELLKLSTLDQESELYWASLDYLASNENGRQIFMTLPDEKQKIKYLERATGKNELDTLYFLCFELWEFALDF